MIFHKISCTRRSRANYNAVKEVILNLHYFNFVIFFKNDIYFIVN